MFSTEHILYIIISLSVIALTLFLAHFIKNKKWKDFFLLSVSLICFFIHISTMYTSLFENGGARGTVADNQILPIYFCNYVMYLLLIVSVWGDKNSKLFKTIATFTAYGGIFGALITLFIVEPGVGTWWKFQSALSHSFLLLGSLYLFVGGYVKINVCNIIPFGIGLLSSGVVGGIVELVYFLNGLPPRNCMYLIHGPSEAPFMNAYIFAIVLSLLVFAFTAIWEKCTRQKEERWYKTAKDISLYFNIKNKKKQNNNTNPLIETNNNSTNKIKEQ